ncbi:sulfite exporter TauE/SafE family protein [uncultured Desulfobacter sp.]|uniref:sulfite exporter TauE/SafE family protein n=1 Tax=uncultured Desulfobacter sp. TaxID=240139 RepID=UPI0029F50763|nr:sulfite exporter TauE/SafE family protein [uncultured Desulfobacter sp.]
MIFHTAGIEVQPWIPPLVAFGISFFTSMGGISGAFLLLPFQMSFLGYVNPSVSATNQLFNIIAIPSGVYRYYREGRMVWPLAWVVILGTLPGVFIGAFLRVAYLPDPVRFKLFASAVLFYIGVKMTKDLLKKRRAAPQPTTTYELQVQDEDGFYFSRPIDPEERFATDVINPTASRFNLKRLRYIVDGREFDISFWGIFSLSFIVGIVGGVYGIGGGAIIAPFFVTFFRLPVHTVAGATLMGTFITSIAGVAFYQGIAPFFPGISVAPDWGLGLLFGLGGMVGMYLGAYCQKYVSANLIKWMLTGIIFLTAIRYATAFLGL